MRLGGTVANPAEGTAAIQAPTPSKLPPIAAGGAALAGDLVLESAR